MSKPSSGLFAGTMGSAAESSLESGRSVKLVSKAKPQSMAPERIRFSQTSVNGSEQIVESMKKNGWQGDPIEFVRMDDGELTTLDNTRVVAARAAGIDVMANVHAYKPASRPSHEKKVHDAEGRSAPIVGASCREQDWIN